MSDTKALKLQRRRIRRRWVVVIVLGVLLGLLTIGFLRTIYNPFATGVPDPLVLVPEDMDFVLSVPDLPRLARELSDRHFMSEVGAHPGFGEFIESSWARDRGVVDAVRKGLLELQSFRGSLPLGLDLFGDISGTHVVVAGYVPELPGARSPAAIGSGSNAAVAPLHDPNAPPKNVYRFMAVIRPESWMTVAFANILMNETLYGWFLADTFQREGITVQHFRDSVRVHPKKLGRDFHVTRIADTILVSTEGEQLSRIHKSVALDGLPRHPHFRYQKLMPGYDDGASDITLLARRSALQQETKFDAELTDLWGPDTKSLAEASLPRYGSEDVRLRLGVGEGLSMSVVGAQGPARERDVSTTLKAFDRGRLESETSEIMELMPKEAFGLLYVESDLGDLFRRLTDQPAIMNPSELKLFTDFCSQVPSFRLLEGFFAVLNEVADDRLGIVFFKQPREPIDDRAAAGFAIVARIENEKKLREALSEIETVIRSAEGMARIATRIVKRKAGSIEVFEPVWTDQAFDDSRVTKPAIGIVRGRLVLTNFAPLFDEMAVVESDPSKAMARNDGLRRSLGYAPRMLRAAVAIDGAAAYPYLKQSAPGWATERTRPTQRTYMKFRAEFPGSAAAKNVVPGNRNYEVELEKWLQQKVEALNSVERPAVQRQIGEVLRQFDGLLAGAGFFVEDGVSELAISLRCDVRP